MTARISVAAKLYSRQALRAAAEAVGGPARFFLIRKGGRFVVEAQASSAASARKALERVLSEALGHSLRQRLIRFNRAFSAAAAAALLERGLSPCPPDPLEELEPQVREDRAQERRQLLEAARREPGA